MKKYYLLTAVQLLLAMALSACTVNILGEDDKQEPKFSGYLQDYSKLQEQTDQDGNIAWRWVSPEISSGKYDKVFIEQVKLYPEPTPSEQASAQVIDEINAYLNDHLKSQVAKVANVVPIVDNQTLRLRAAITSVGIAVKELQGDERKDPLNALSATISRAVGTREHSTDIYLEAEIVEALTGKRLAAVVRKKEAQSLDGEFDKLELKHVQGTLDSIVTDASQFFSNTIGK